MKVRNLHILASCVVNPVFSKSGKGLIPVLKHQTNKEKSEQKRSKVLHKKLKRHICFKGGKIFGIFKSLESTLRKMKTFNGVKAQKNHLIHIFNDLNLFRTRPFSSKG